MEKKVVPDQTAPSPKEQSDRGLPFFNSIIWFDSSIFSILFILFYLSHNIERSSVLSHLKGFRSFL